MGKSSQRKSGWKTHPLRSRAGVLLVAGIWASVLLVALAFLLTWRTWPLSRKTVSLPVSQQLNSVDKSSAGKGILPIQSPAAPPTPVPENPTETPDPFPTPDPLPTPTPLPFAAGPQVIGYSVGERPLEVYRFGSGPDVRVIIAGIHGGYEWNTVALADALIGHLRVQPDVVPNQVTLYILRVMNPDGLARGQWYEGRLNENGVDLNRNFPANWQAEWPNEGCWGHLAVSSGTSPASEPETQAVMAFLRQHRVTALISYHSAALGVFPGGIPLHLPSVQLAQEISAATTYPYPPYDTGCLYTGTLADWAAQNGIAAIDLELHTHSDPDIAENMALLPLFLSWQPDVVTGR